MKTTNKRASEYSDGDEKFATWLNVVDRLVQNRVEVSLFDLEDMLLRDSYDAGETPRQCIYETVYPNVLESYGVEMATYLLT